MKQYNQRKPNRLQGYDYKKPGFYFVTICTQNHLDWFGSIIDEQMMANQPGEIVIDCWQNLPKHYLNCCLDSFVLMPNHFHGIIHIIDKQNHGLSEIIRGFKTFSSRKINQLIDENEQNIVPNESNIVGNESNIVRNESNIVRNGFKPFPTKKFKWQKSFFDHIIRNDCDLNRIREYIINNPLQWEIKNNKGQV